MRDGVQLQRVPEQDGQLSSELRGGGDLLPRVRPHHAQHLLHRHARRLLGHLRGKRLRGDAQPNAGKLVLGQAHSQEALQAPSHPRATLRPTDPQKNTDQKPQQCFVHSETSSAGSVRPSAAHRQRPEPSLATVPVRNYGGSEHRGDEEDSQKGGTESGLGRPDQKHQRGHRLSQIPSRHQLRSQLRTLARRLPSPILWLSLESGLFLRFVLTLFRPWHHGQGSRQKVQGHHPRPRRLHRQYSTYQKVPRKRSQRLSLPTIKWLHLIHTNIYIIFIIIHLYIYIYIFHYISIFSLTILY